jgi:hypothetical protein
MTRLVLVAALLVTACKKGDPGPPCDKVVDHMLELTKQMMPGHDPESLGNRNQRIAECKQRKMPASMRKCLLDAKSFNDLADCRRKDTSAAAAPSAPAPKLPANVAPTAPAPTNPAPTAPAPTNPAPTAPAATAPANPAP